ncbi:MAG: alkaline phosphatase family protein [Sarcina sp.]
MIKINKKLIFILIDGLSFEVGKNRMGFLMHLVEQQKASFHKVICEVPTLSRTMYETIFTGITPYNHGIVGNEIKRLSKEENIFKVARSKNLKTAAAAYYWMSELYVKAGFDKTLDRFLDNEKSDIQHGIFYFDEEYPDNHVYYDAEYLRKKYDPNFLLIHPMNVDTRGHQYGYNSAKYRNGILKNDHIIINLVPQWIEEGYKIIITGDHGISEDGTHGGILDIEREVPLWIIGDENLGIKELVGQRELFNIMKTLLEI